MCTKLASFNWLSGTRSGLLHILEHGSVPAVALALLPVHLGRRLSPQIHLLPADCIDCSSPEKTDTKNCLRCGISDWLRRLHIDEAESFRTPLDDGRRDPVCYSAYFADIVSSSRHQPTSSTKDELAIRGIANLPITPISSDSTGHRRHPSEACSRFRHDALTSIVLATEAELLLAPAMNGKMWMHPATVANVEILRQRGANFIGPEKGIVACGYEEIGRLWPVD